MRSIKAAVMLLVALALVAEISATSGDLSAYKRCALSEKLSERQALICLVTHPATDRCDLACDRE